MHTESRPNEFRLTLTYALALAALVVTYKVLLRYLPTGTLGWNLVPLGALGLFIGSRLRTRWAYLVPLAASFVADLLIIPAVAAEGYASMDVSTPFTYLGFALYVAIGRLVREHDLSPWTIGAAATCGSVVFFLVSNFGSWVASPVYPRSLTGVIECYIAGVPYYSNTLLSDLVFPAVFFGLHAVLMRAQATSEVEQPA